MSPVGRTEGVVHIDLAQGGQATGKVRIVPGLPIIEPDVFQ